jgi:hypothetical protein
VGTNYILEFTPELIFSVEVNHHMTQDTISLLKYIHRYGHNFDIICGVQVGKLFRVRVSKDKDDDQPFLEVLELEITGSFTMPLN